MRRSLNTFQAMEVKHLGEVNNTLSETIPGQAISAPELLRRFATGQPLGFKNVNPIYDDPNLDEIPEFYKLSQLDRLHIMQENADRVQTAKENLRYYQRIEQQQKQQKQQNQEQKEAKEKEKMADSVTRSTSEQ